MPPKKATVTRYRLDLNGFKASLREVLGNPWVNALARELQNSLQDADVQGRNVIDEAVRFAGDLRRTSRDPPHVCTGQLPTEPISDILPISSGRATPNIWDIMANYANLLLAKTALEDVHVRLLQSQIAARTKTLHRNLGSDL
jgi:hypothetical protein